MNMMDARKKSMQARGQAKVRDAVRRRMGKEPASEKGIKECQAEDGRWTVSGPSHLIGHLHG